MLNSDLDREKSNVHETINLLYESVTEYRNNLMDSIKRLANERKSTDEIKETLAKVDQVNSFFESIERLRASWTLITNDTDLLSERELDNEIDNDKKEAAARTTWKL